MLGAVERLFAKKGWAPTWREIAAELGIVSTNAVSETLRRLKARGRVHWDECTGQLGTRGRALVLLKPLTPEECRTHNVKGATTTPGEFFAPSKCYRCGAVSFRSMPCFECAHFLE
jgi:SOS-response transcriptional repressor LexA